MMYATTIKMQPGCTNSNNVEEIKEIYIEGCNNPGFFQKSTLHDYLKTNPNSIKVKITPYPYLIPKISTRNEKYVSSEPNNNIHDNLLKLPRM